MEWAYWSVGWIFMTIKSCILFFYYVSLVEYFFLPFIRTSKFKFYFFQISWNTAKKRRILLLMFLRHSKRTLFVFCLFQIHNCVLSMFICNNKAVGFHIHTQKKHIPFHMWHWKLKIIKHYTLLWFQWIFMQNFPSISFLTNQKTQKRKCFA